MLVENRVKSNIAPPKFINLGNGKWYYNYDIRPEEVEGFEIGNSTEAVKKLIYSYIVIKFAGRPEYKKCVEILIREFITQSQEFDLINSYNKSTLGMLSEEETTKAKTDYFDYLQKLEEIKTNVKKDFEDFK